MKEITILDMNLVYGGTYSENQCIAGIAGAGATAGAIVGGVVGFGVGAAVGTAAGQIICPATNNGNDSEDGDG